MPTIARLTILAFLLRLIWLLAILLFGNDQATFLPDSYNYLEAGNSMLHGHGLTLLYHGKYYPALHLLPGYPLFAASFSAAGTTLLVVFAQLLLSTVTVYLTLSWLSQLILHRWLFLAIALVIVLDLPSLVYTGYMLSETLFTFLLLWGSYLLFQSPGRRNYAYWGALLLGVACLVRPIGIVMIPGAGLVALIAYKGNARRRVALLIAVSLLPPLLWTARNWVHLGYPVYSIVAAQNMYYYRAAGVEARHSGRAPAMVRKSMTRKVKHAHNWEADYNAQKMAAIYWKRSWEIFNSHPFTALKVQANGMTRLLASPVRGALQFPFKSVSPLRQSGPLVWLAMIFQWLMLAVLYGQLIRSLFRWRRWQKWQWIILGAVMAYALACGGPEIQARFRIPIIVLLPLLVVSGQSGDLHDRIS